MHYIVMYFVFFFFFCFKQKTAYVMCGRDWSSDVCSSDLGVVRGGRICYRQYLYNNSWANAVTVSIPSTGTADALPDFTELNRGWFIYWQEVM